MEKLRNQIKDKLYEELEGYKKNVLEKTKEEIFGSSFKTEVFINLYEILNEKLDEYNEMILSEMIRPGYFILEGFYQEYISNSGEDPIYADLQNLVNQEIYENPSRFHRNIKYIVGGM